MKVQRKRRNRKIKAWQVYKSLQYIFFLCMFILGIILIYCCVTKTLLEGQSILIDFINVVIAYGIVFGPCISFLSIGCFCEVRNWFPDEIKERMNQKKYHIKEK